jgi:hypothetical protein
LINHTVAGHLWLTPIIPATQEAENKRMVVWSHPRQKIHKALCQKYPTHTHTHKQGWWSDSGGTEPAYKVWSSCVFTNCVFPHLSRNLERTERRTDPWPPWEYWAMWCHPLLLVMAPPRAKPKRPGLRHRGAEEIGHGRTLVFLQYWDLNSGCTPWVIPSALFVMGFFEMGSRQLFCPGWLPATILLISASWVTVKEGPCAGSGEGGQRSETWSRKVHKRLLLFCFYWSIDWIISEEKVCIWEVCVWPVHRCKRKGRAPWHPPSAWGRDRRAASLEPKALWGGSCVITAIYQDSSPQGFGCFPFIQLVYLGGNWCQ